jgi:hypothetical protein
MKNQNVASITLHLSDGRNINVGPTLPVAASRVALLAESGDNMMCEIFSFTFGLPDEPKPTAPTFQIFAKDSHDARRLAEAFDFINTEVNNLINADADMSLPDMIALAAIRYNSNER